MPDPLHDGQYIHDGTIYHDGELIHRLREYEYEFDVAGMRYRNASIRRRPDAVSPDYLTSFTVGPRAIGDAGTGIVNRLWRIRAVGHTIFIAKTDKSFTGEE